MCPLIRSFVISWIMYSQMVIAKWQNHVHLFTDNDRLTNMPHVFAHLFGELSTLLSSSFFNSQRSPRPIWSMRTSWPWRCLCSSLWTTTLHVSMWPSLKGSLWVIRETTRICLESGASWEMKRWDCLIYQYLRDPNVIQLNSRISSLNLAMCILY